MEKFIHKRSFQILVLIIFFFILVPPRFSSALHALTDSDLTDKSPSTIEKQDVKSDSHLHPINEKQLDKLSPSLVAPVVEKESVADRNRIMRNKFENSICFIKCHQRNEFKPSDHTAKQWRLLIEEDGHAIFEKINWDSPQEKEEIVNYLLQNSKDSKPDAAGIGVW